MSKNNGGPAFPYQVSLQSGMSLRDYFAAQAMQGMLALHTKYIIHIEQLSKDAYAAADAMLAEREREK